MTLQWKIESGSVFETKRKWIFGQVVQRVKLEKVIRRSNRHHFRFCVSYIPVGMVQNLFMQVDLLVALPWILDSKSKKKIRKHLLDHLYNFAVCFFVANQTWGLYGYGFVGF